MGHKHKICPFLIIKRIFSKNNLIHIYIQTFYDVYFSFYYEYWSHTFLNQWNHMIYILRHVMSLNNQLEWLLQNILEESYGVIWCFYLKPMRMNAFHMTSWCLKYWPITSANVIYVTSFNPFKTRWNLAWYIRELQRVNRTLYP